MLTLLVNLVSCQVANTLDTYIASYCSDQFMDEITIESVEDCFDQAIGVNPIIARRCRPLDKSPLERKQYRCAVKPVPTSLYSSLVSQCYIKEATQTGDRQTVMQVKNVQSIMDSFNFLLIRGYMKSQAAELEMCLQSAFSQRPAVGGQMTPGQSIQVAQSSHPNQLIQPLMPDGHLYGPTSRVRVRRQVYVPAPSPGQQYGPAYGPAYGPGYGQQYGPGYGQQYGPAFGPQVPSSPPDYGYQQNPSYPTSYDPYQPYSMGRYQRDYLWRQRRRQIDRDLRSLGYTR